MMPLRTMWNVDRTIDASGSSPVAASILADWEHDRGSIRFFRSSANFLYVFRRDGKPHFLRFADGVERSRAAVEAEIALLQWLAGEGISVVLPVRSGNGNFVETIATDWGTFHAVVFPAVEGGQFDVGELDGTRFRKWGAALGRLHTAMSRCPAEIAAARGTWRDCLERAHLAVPDDASSVREEMDRIAAALGDLPANGDTYGLIHFEFDLDNLVWGEHSVHLLDFDDCAHCWFVADIAFALRDLFADGASKNDPEVQAFLAGYAAYHPHDEELLARLPLFVRLANLQTYARVVVPWTSLRIQRNQDG